jgi:hypothetical protein
MANPATDTPTSTPLYKTGRLKAERSRAFKDFEYYQTEPLPTPPKTFEVPGQAELNHGKVLYPMDGNDKFGDCTMAGVDHLNRGASILYKEPYSNPSTAVITKEYFTLSGGQDTGLVEQDVLNTWHTTGLFGTKIAAFAPVSITSLLLWHQAISMYGGLYLGIACPQSAQVQFQNGEPWTYEGEQTEDGHCVVALGYGPNGGLHCATWGGIAVLTPSFLAHYLDEAWVVLSQQLFEARQDSLGINVEALQKDIARI